MPIDITGLDAVERSLDRLLAEAPRMRRSLHERVGNRVLQELQREIAVRVRDENGHIRSFQEVYLGSGGGYAAVRPAKGDVPGKSWRGRPLAKGALTNFLESGHAIRRPSGTAKRYRQRLHMTRVEPRAFYRAAGEKLMGIAMEEAEAMIEEMEGMLNA